MGRIFPDYTENWLHTLTQLIIHEIISCSGWKEHPTNCQLQDFMAEYEKNGLFQDLDLKGSMVVAGEPGLYCSE